MASLRKRREGDFWKVTSPLTSRWWKKYKTIAVDVTYHAPCSDVTVGALITTVTEGLINLHLFRKTLEICQ